MKASERIEQIRKRLEAATPGEWKHAAYLSGKVGEPDVVYSVYVGDDMTPLPRTFENAALQSNAPADLSFLLSRLERAAQDEREACAKIADRYSDDYKAFDERGIAAFRIADLIRARSK